MGNDDPEDAIFGGAEDVCGMIKHSGRFSTRKTVKKCGRLCGLEAGVEPGGKSVGSYILVGDGDGILSDSLVYRLVSEPGDFTDDLWGSKLDRKVAGHMLARGLEKMSGRDTTVFGRCYTRCLRVVRERKLGNICGNYVREKCPRHVKVTKCT